MKINQGSILSVITLICCAISVSFAKAEENEGQSSWQWSSEQIDAQINKVRAARDLQPEQWPQDNKIAVLFSFDVDNETNTLSKGGDADSLLLSFEQYGARKGLSRIVRLLDRHEIPATFFIPAVSLQLAPQMAALIEQSGRHEIAAHGWIHESVADLSRDQEKRLIQKSRDYLEEHTGQKPVGYRAPFGIYSLNTHSILEELGFLYDSGLGADDSPHALIVNGEPSRLIELPGNINFEDSVLDPMNTFTAGITDPRVMLQSYKDGFDTLYEEGTMMLLILHPHVTGRPSRITVLEDLIEYMKARGGVWFATHREAAEYVMQTTQ